MKAQVPDVQYLGSSRVWQLACFVWLFIFLRGEASENTIIIAICISGQKHF